MTRREHSPVSVYTVGMANKRRVNITIDSAVHEEMRKFLDITSSDFSAFVEAICVSFLGEMRPLIRRMEAAQNGGEALTPSELRVMFLQMMGGVHVNAGAQLNTILQELDTIEAEQKKNEVPKLLEAESIHTPKVTKRTKVKK